MKFLLLIVFLYLNCILCGQKIITISKSENNKIVINPSIESVINDIQHDNHKFGFGVFIIIEEAVNEKDSVISKVLLYNHCEECRVNIKKENDTLYTCELFASLIDNSDSVVPGGFGAIEYKFLKSNLVITDRNFKFLIDKNLNEIDIPIYSKNEIEKVISKYVYFKQNKAYSSEDWSSVTLKNQCEISELCNELLFASINGSKDCLELFKQIRADFPIMNAASNSADLSIKESILITYGYLPIKFFPRINNH